MSKGIAYLPAIYFFDVNSSMKVAPKDFEEFWDNTGKGFTTLCTQIAPINRDIISTPSDIEGFLPNLTIRQNSTVS